MVKAPKEEQLEKIKAEIIKQKITPELAASATQLVFGDGNPDADIVFVGEAPGKNEDLQGKPFVGAAGKFLDEMLGTIGLERDDIYITNIVKYRPPNNRDPFPDEKAAFLPFLKQQLLTIQPKLIVTLGRHSMETLLPGLKISQVHGQPKRVKIHRSHSHLDETDGKDGLSSTKGEDDAWVILPLFHPAAALYNGALRATLIEDFAKIPRILELI